MVFSSYSAAQPLALATAVLYVVGLVVYRLFLHPLRSIPGPKLAAATQWVETYHECKAPGGQFMWEIMKWHDKYGPVVRIAPNEVHIQDSAFYDEFYVRSGRLIKLEHLAHRFDNALSAFATVEADHHRIRRGALNPFFSKAKISQYSPKIQQYMDALCTRLSKEYVGTGAVLSLNNMWGASTTDIVVDYTCGKKYDFISQPDFRVAFADSMQNLLEPVHFITQFPILMTMLKLLPDWLTVMLNPDMAPVFHMDHEMAGQVIQARQELEASKSQVDGNLSPDEKSHSSVFAALLDSDLPPQELTTPRVKDEAKSIVGAALETTTFSLSVASYHLLANPPILKKLMEELLSAIPEPMNVPHLDVLMQLPYLTCVINEALRLSYGISQRIPRLCPTPVVYTSSPSNQQTVLPVGTIISMDNVAVSQDSTIFPNPLEFRPERWEKNALAPDGSKLTRYLVTFSKGARSCVGMHVAYADLYIGLATFFRRFECELFETDRDAIDVYMDRFAPRPKPGTKGVRVRVLRDLAA